MGRASQARRVLFLRTEQYGTFYPRVGDELAEVRFRASTETGVQESYAAMFPAPRQRWVDAMVTPDDAIAALPHETLVVHGREDRVVPRANSYRLMELIPRVELHVFGFLTRDGSRAP